MPARKEIGISACCIKIIDTADCRVVERRLLFPEIFQLLNRRIMNVGINLL